VGMPGTVADIDIVLAEAELTRDGPVGQLQGSQ